MEHYTLVPGVTDVTEVTEDETSTTDVPFDDIVFDIGEFHYDIKYRDATLYIEVYHASKFLFWNKTLSYNLEGSTCDIFKLLEISPDMVYGLFEDFYLKRSNNLMHIIFPTNYDNDDMSLCINVALEYQRRDKVERDKIPIVLNPKCVSDSELVDLKLKNAETHVQSDILALRNDLDEVKKVYDTTKKELDETKKELTEIKKSLKKFCKKVKDGMDAKFQEFQTKDECKQYVNKEYCDKNYVTVSKCYDTYMTKHDCNTTLLTKKECDEKYLTKTDATDTFATLSFLDENYYNANEAEDTFHSKTKCTENCKLCGV